MAVGEAVINDEGEKNERHAKAQAVEEKIRDHREIE